MDSLHNAVIGGLAGLCGAIWLGMLIDYLRSRLASKRLELEEGWDWERMKEI